jgi:hypothetical protein
MFAVQDEPSQSFAEDVPELVVYLMFCSFLTASIIFATKQRLGLLILSARTD